MKATPRQEPRTIETTLGPVTIYDRRSNETERGKDMYQAIARIEFESVSINRKDYGQVNYWLDRTWPGRTDHRVTPEQWGPDLTPAARGKVREVLDALEPEFAVYVAPLDPGDTARDRMDRLENKIAEAAYDLTHKIPGTTDEEIREAMRRVYTQHVAGSTFSQIYFGRNHV